MPLHAPAPWAWRHPLPSRWAPASEPRTGCLSRGVTLWRKCATLPALCWDPDVPAFGHRSFRAAPLLRLDDDCRPSSRSSLRRIRPLFSPPSKLHSRSVPHAWTCMDVCRPGRGQPLRFITLVPCCSWVAVKVGARNLSCAYTITFLFLHGLFDLGPAY